MPVVGSSTPHRLTCIRTSCALWGGLKDSGYFEGENVAIEYRWAEDQVDRLPALMANWPAGGSRDRRGGRFQFGVRG